MMNKKIIWYLFGTLIAAVAVFSAACAVIEPPNEPLPVAKIVPPKIPHTLEGRADCRLCHEKGLGGAPQFPADHGPRPSEVCISCHIKPPANGTPQDAAAHLPPPTTPMPAPTPTAPVTTSSPAPAAVSAKDLYSGKCAACHGINREGGFGPALTPESLATKSDDQLKTVISDGKAGTAMPGFKSSLSAAEIGVLVEFIKNVTP